MAARVCVGGAGAGAEPTPPTLTHSAPQPGRSARCLFLLGAHHPRQPPHPPRLSHHHRRPDPAGTPPAGSPDQTQRPVPPRPSRRLPGIQWSGGKTRPNVPRGEGRGDPLPRPGGPPPLTLLPAFQRRRGQWGSGWCSPGRRWRAFISPSCPSPAPPPQIPAGVAGDKRGLRQAGEGWIRKEAIGSPPPHRP